MLHLASAFSHTHDRRAAWRDSDGGPVVAAGQGSIIDRCPRPSAQGIENRRSTSRAVSRPFIMRRTTLSLTKGKRNGKTTQCCTYGTAERPEWNMLTLLLCRLDQLCRLYFKNRQHSLTRENYRRAHVCNKGVLGWPALIDPPARVDRNLCVKARRGLPRACRAVTLENINKMRPSPWRQTSRRRTRVLESDHRITLEQ